MTTERSNSSAVRVSFLTDRMPHSTELKRLLRALDCLYYSLLFAREEDYHGNAEVWRTWVKLGFGTGLQVGPPSAAPSDRIGIHTFSNSKELTFTVRGGRPSTVQRWRQLLDVIDRHRPDVSGLEADVRAKELSALSDIRTALIEPVSAAIAACPAEDAQRIEVAVQTALAALTYPILKEIRLVEADQNA